MSQPNVLWEANSSVQKAFLACSARTALMGGGAGSGKTSALLAAAAAQSGNSKHRAVIFRRDYPSLRHIISASYQLFLPMRASYNKAEHTWRWPSGSTLEFGHLEDETALYQQAGKDYSFLGFDELTQLPGDAVDSRGQPINSAFSFLQSRLRASADSGLKLEIRCTATPGGPGMQWVKSYFRILDSGESTEFVDEVTGFRRAYFKSTFKDNPALAGTDYHQQFLGLPAARQKALLLGDWSACIGQIFTSWDYQKHTCEPFAVPYSWELWRGADDGFSAPAAVLYFAHDKTYDRLFVVQELYQAGMTAETMAANVLTMDSQIPISFGPGDIEPNDEPLSGVIDAASFSNSGGGSRANVMNSLGCRWQASVKGPGSRLAGISAIHSRLAMRPDGRPGLIIFRTCQNLIQQLPALPYSTRNPEDADERATDHAVEALRIGLTRKARFFRRVRVTGI